jgi:hypothetical protein
MAEWVRFLTEIVWRALNDLVEGVTMAKGSMMLQIGVEQLLSPAMSSAPEIWAVAVDSLDGDRTTVREIATEKSHQFYGWADEEHEFGELHFSQDALTDLWLVFNEPRRPPAILHAPSHVPSPPIDGARIVVLRVRDFGYSFDPPARFVLGRRVGSHAYLDEEPAG